MRHRRVPFSHSARQASGNTALIVLILLVLLSLPALPGAATQPAGSEQGTLLDSFEQYPPLTFPSQWRVRGNEATAHHIYQVAEEHGERFLHAYAERQAIQIGMAYTVQPKAFPGLRWRWRVLQLPPGGDEGRKDTHDSAAGVYVVFDNPFLPRVLKYVWSTTVPVGTQLQNPLYWRAKIIVLRSGAEGLGAWRQETVNFYQDYRALFGAEPGPVLGIGLMTSSSFTQSVAIADYDEFQLLPAAGLPSAALGGLSLQGVPVAFAFRDKPQLPTD